MQKVVVADKLFTGTEWLQRHAVVIERGVIKSVLPPDQIPSGAKNYEEAFLAPAFIDAQVYGAAKKLFAVIPTADTLQVMHDEFIKTGTCLFQPTAATNTIDVFKKCIDAVREYWKMGGKGVYGLHLEGPWLNHEKRGAHVKEWIHSPEIEEVKDLLEYGKGVVTMITVAPEICSDEVLELIRSYNIVISAGHSNAKYDEAISGFEKGISAVTHLYNAMSPFQHRAPGLTGATLNDKSVMASIIPDGYHVDYPAVQIAKKIMGGRLFAITDAVTETNSGPYQHQLSGDKYECNGTLSGSALSMYQAFLNLINGVGIELDEALRMCSLYPARALRCDDMYGKIVPQAAGQLIVLDNELRLLDVIT
jgi:N-acetylglucosamine-6-phosphate deacetylase